MNNISLIGRLTKEPELKSTSNGNKVISFCLAVDRRTKDKATDWIDCVAWNKTAEIIAQYCHKGKMLSVTGSLQTRTWEDNEGNKHKVTEVNVMSIDLLGGSEKADKPSEEAVTADEPEPAVVDQAETIGGLPFEL